MKISLIAVGHKMPNWVDEAAGVFLKRLQEHAKFTIKEIPLQNRNNAHDSARISEKEAQKIELLTPKDAHRIALAIHGKSFTSEKLASRMATLQQTHSSWCFYIGGPEGLPKSVIQSCDELWSLSPLTLPHPIARVVLLEALYRGFSIINNHPYHK